jgi:putative ABC transport system ATP-binding protein
MALWSLQEWMRSRGVGSTACSPAGTAVIEIDEVTKTYGRGAAEVAVLEGLAFRVPEPCFAALTGPTGCGKTTLLDLVAGIDVATRGRVLVAGTDLAQLSERALAKWRARNVGLIPQECTLIPVLTALENVQMPLLLSPVGKRERRERATAALAATGASRVATCRSHELCALERRRVAIARAIVAAPKLLLADEPTRKIDREGAQAILRLLREQRDSLGATLLLATSDHRIAAQADLCYELPDGRWPRGSIACTASPSASLAGSAAGLVGALGPARVDVEQAVIASARRRWYARPRRSLRCVAPPRQAIW